MIQAARDFFVSIPLRITLFLACVLLGVQALTKPYEIRDALVPELISLQRRYPFYWRRWSTLWWALFWIALTITPHFL